MDKLDVVDGFRTYSKDSIGIFFASIVFRLYRIFIFSVLLRKCRTNSPRRQPPLLVYGRMTGRPLKNRGMTFNGRRRNTIEDNVIGGSSRYCYSRRDHRHPPEQTTPFKLYYRGLNLISIEFKTLGKTLLVYPRGRQVGNRRLPSGH